MTRLFKRSEETRKKISETCKLRGVGIWTKGKFPWNKGKKQPKEVKEKISYALKGRKMPYVSEANKIREYSSETRELRSKVAKRNWSNPKYKAKMLSINVKGENHPAYIKDRSLIKISDNRRDDVLYKDWVRQVKTRDNWKCKLKNSDCKGKLEAHHIFSWRDNKDLRYVVNNGITLCHAHHPHIRNEAAKQVALFKSLIE